MFIVAFSAINLSMCSNGFTNLDETKYEEGRRQYEIINGKTKLPMYGQCWKDALVKIQTGCRELTDVVQSQLALLYLNCFLRVSGKAVYTCDLEKSVTECTKDMTNTDLSTYATFFTQTHSICYFLEAQNWQNEAEQTISKLAASSANMVEVLEESAILQESIVRKQNVTLENQDKILLKASNLSNVVATASTNVLEIISSFEQTTFDQRRMMNDIFDKVANLQSAVLGGFSRFYSLIYYTLSILVSCLLTSARRTSGARFWLLAIMTINIIVERLILFYYGGSTPVKDGNKMAEAEMEETVYAYQWLIRQISAILSLLVLLFYIYIYRNLSLINNQLLMKVKKQNSELKHQMKELSKEISILRHYVMNQPITDSDDSDEESTKKKSIQSKTSTKSKFSMRALFKNTDDPTSVKSLERDHEETELDVDHPTASGTDTMFTTSGAKEAIARTESPEPIRLSEKLLSSPIVKYTEETVNTPTGRPLLSTSGTGRPTSTSAAESMASTSGISETETPATGETASGETLPPSRYSLRSRSPRESPT